MTAHASAAVPVFTFPICHSLQVMPCLSVPLISTKLEAISSATKALLRLLFMATLKAMPWHMMMVPCMTTITRATRESETRCLSCRLLQKNSDTTDVVMHQHAQITHGCMLSLMRCQNLQCWCTCLLLDLVAVRLGHVTQPRLLRHTGMLSSTKATSLPLSRLLACVICNTLAAVSAVRLLIVKEDRPCSCRGGDNSIQIRRLYVLNMLKIKRHC